VSDVTHTTTENIKNDKKEFAHGTDRGGGGGGMSRVHKLSDVTTQQFTARTASAPTERLPIAAQIWKL